MKRHHVGLLSMLLPDRNSSLLVVLDLPRVEAMLATWRETARWGRALAVPLDQAWIVDTVPGPDSVLGMAAIRQLVRRPPPLPVLWCLDAQLGEMWWGLGSRASWKEDATRLVRAANVLVERGGPEPLRASTRHLIDCFESNPRLWPRTPHLPDSAVHWA